MKNLRILFMGTPEFAVHILDRLIANNKNVVGVVTAPDKPAGRGRKLHQSAVKQFALKKNLTVLQPTNLKSDDFQEALARLEPDLQIVVAFRMLPKKVWSFPTYGTFNLHASLLPQYRGAAPINWAIMNGETKTGVTTFFIDEKIDTGAVIDQVATEIDPHETAGELHDRLMQLGGELVIKTVETIENGRLSTKAQPLEGTLKTAYKFDKENTKIDWRAPGKSIYDFVRGLNPFPVAWTPIHHDNKVLNCKIYRVEFHPQEHTETLGSIHQEQKKLAVAVKDGFINITEMQLPGKKKMDIQSLLNGFQFSENAKVG